MKKTIVFLLTLILTLMIFSSCATSTMETDSKEYWPTDTWRTGKPEKLGFDAKMLKETDSYIQSVQRHISSILVLRNGYIAYEEYYSGDIGSLRGLYTGTSSILSALTGILIADGEITNIEDKIIEYLPSSLKNQVSSGVGEVTVKHLLTMSSGFPFNSSCNILRHKFLSELLSEPLKSRPGESFDYNNVNPNVMSIITTETSGLLASQFAEDRLFSALGIKDYLWMNSKNYSHGSDGLHLKSRDIAKIGYLYLKKGRWQNLPLIAESYIKESVTKQMPVPDSENKWDMIDLHYGYHWWTWRMDEQRVYGILGSGYGGQCILCVIPDINMVIVITGDGTTFDLINPMTIIEDYILEALIKE